MHTLMDVASGAYLVETEASRYVIDLDDMTITRQPRTLDASYLPGDDTAVDLLQVVECTVGRPMKLRIDLHKEGVPYTNRTTTFVESIQFRSAT